MSVSFEVDPGCAGRRTSERNGRRVQMARRVTAARLRFCGLNWLVDDATLIVSELVTNAIVHSGTTSVTLTVRLLDGVLRISVTDGVPGTPAPSQPDADAEGGRGLQLIEYLVSEHDGRWGVAEQGATVWCTLPVRGATP
ncbi:ATP-binding protein [Streptomyces sp. NPDC127197]|uniref:ATP-binding protein n=1 Tax=Streptomyces sp. NPDC127197 TaxID=3345388 RepID=UPI003642CAA4